MKAGEQRGSRKCLCMCAVRFSACVPAGCPLSQGPPQGPLPRLLTQPARPVLALQVIGIKPSCEGASRRVRSLLLWGGAWEGAGSQPEDRESGRSRSRPRSLLAGSSSIAVDSRLAMPSGTTAEQAQAGSGTFQAAAASAYTSGQLASSGFQVTSTSVDVQAPVVVVAQGATAQVSDRGSDGGDGAWKLRVGLGAGIGGGCVLLAAVLAAVIVAARRSRQRNKVCDVDAQGGSPRAGSTGPGPSGSGGSGSSCGGKGRLPEVAKGAVPPLPGDSAQGH